MKTLKIQTTLPMRTLTILTTPARPARRTYLTLIARKRPSLKSAKLKMSLPQLPRRAKLKTSLLQLPRRTSLTPRPKKTRTLASRIYSSAILAGTLMKNGLVENLKALEKLSDAESSATVIAAGQRVLDMSNSPSQLTLQRLLLL